jgi:hypothetical protein
VYCCSDAGTAPGEFRKRTDLADIKKANLDLALSDLLLAGIEADDS